jgi:Cd2+/Zn2+-exporting ATPase
MPKPQPVSCLVCEIHAESVFRVEGMDCHEEVAILDRRLKGMPGLERLRADVMTGRLTVTYDAARTSASAIADAVADTGMRAWLEHEAPALTVEAGGLSRQAMLLVSGGAIALGWGLEWSGARELVSTPAYAVAVAAGGWYWGRRAWSAARLFSLDINVLMVLAVIGAMLIGEWSEAATVTFLFAIAQWLESRNMERARHAIRGLMELTPVEATVRREGYDRRVNVDDVALGDVLVVRPGEKIPLDGRVVNGHSDVNQAPITGESMPVPKAPGIDVFAGTINGHGALEVAVTRLRRDTTLARIINLVEHAQAERAPSQTFVERFARVYTPAVVAAAIAVAVVPPLAAGEPFGPWFYRALVLLVISCPCALVISTPVAVVSALAAAARKGVLIKGGRHLEALGRVACLAFDKTGTLTRGVPDLRRVVALGAATAHDVLRVATALDARSAHPVGRAILRRAEREGIVVQPGDRHEALPGLGAAAIVDGSPALLGNHRLFEERGLCSDAVEAVMTELSANGDSVVLVAHRGVTIGVMAIADTPREKARESVRLLREGGVEHIVMLTGDQSSTAASVAGDIGITEVSAELLPEHKVDAVRRLKRLYGTVAMVGDGVNDAPALAAADIGIAMGAAGTDAALETADIALMADDLLRIPYAIRLSRATVRTIQVNVALSLGLKAVFLVLASLGLATLWMAVVADMGASLLVIANGMRLLRHD